MLALLLTVFAAQPDGHWAYLDTADLTKIRQSHGRPRRNSSVRGGPIKVGGKTYERGIGTHANSLWIVSTGGNATRFYAEVGVQDGEPEGSAVVFKVLADEETVFVSEPKRPGEPATKVRIPLDGVARIKLEVQQAGGGSRPAAAAWGLAQVEMKSSTDGIVSESAYAHPPERRFAPVATDVLTFPLKFVVCADSDGSNDRGYSDERVPEIVRHLNAAFRQVGVAFTFDPSDFETRRDTLLNRDFDPTDNEHMDKDRPPPEPKKREHVMARSALARESPDKIVIVMRRGSVWTWDEAAGRWVDMPSSENYSDGRIVSPAKSEDPGMFAHEFGHYFGLSHTFGPRPKSLDDVGQMLRDAADRGIPPEDADRVFDGDGIPDTPPDPGTTALESMGYELFVPFQGRKTTVKFDDGRELVYTLSPDVFNTMSYYFDCRIAHPVTKAVSGGFSLGQCLTMRSNAENRKARVADPAAKPKNLALAAWPYASSRPMIQIRASEVGRGRARCVADGQVTAGKDQSSPSFGWDAKPGSSVWLEYEFPEPVTVSQATVTWALEPNLRTAVGLPDSWRVLVPSGEGWGPVCSGSPTIDGGAVTRASFTRQTSRRFRLEARFRTAERSAVVEWELK